MMSTMFDITLHNRAKGSLFSVLKIIFCVSFVFVAIILW